MWRLSRCHLREALDLYEQGTGQLLDSVRRGQVLSQRQVDAVRIKCLLVHDRCELIRNHLESGAPLQVRTIVASSIFPSNNCTSSYLVCTIRILLSSCCT